VLVENYFLGTAAITRGGSYYYYWASGVVLALLRAWCSAAHRHACMSSCGVVGRRQH
jgi:hypothetical protein